MRLFIKVIDKGKFLQTSGRLMEYINATQSSSEDKVTLVQKLKGQEVVINADSQETENLIRWKISLANLIAGIIKVNGVSLI
jgi:hypothetical protein